MNGFDMLRVGVYGGTFAPPHNGHVAAAKAFMEQMKLDYLFIIPTNLPPHKQVDDGDDPLMRLKMCELAFEGVDGIVISDMEITREGKSYTYDTLKELERPDTRLFFLCGTDMVLTFDTWYRFEDILKMCYPVYVRTAELPTPRAKPRRRPRCNERAPCQSTNRNWDDPPREPYPRSLSDRSMPPTKGSHSKPSHRFPPPWEAAFEPHWR